MKWLRRSAAYDYFGRAPEIGQKGRTRNDNSKRSAFGERHALSGLSRLFRELQSLKIHLVRFALFAQGDFRIDTRPFAWPLNLQDQ
jgi:hypothetical protein